MKKNLNWLVIIADRSGSMSSIATEMEKGIKSTVQEQKKNCNGKIMVTGVTFDDYRDLIFKNVSIEEAPEISINPRGSTALLDAIGETITDLEKDYNHLEESERPEKVLFVIVTDGEENSSKKFSKSAINEMIETKKTEGWGFTFIGANIDAIQEGNRLGIDANSSLNYVATAQGVRSMSKDMSGYVTQYFNTGRAEYTDKK